MARKKHNEVVAGLFIVMALAVSLGVVLWLGGSDWFKSKGQLVSFYVPQSQGSIGLQVGEPVTIGDAVVGKIVSIVPQPALSRCLYHVRLDRTDMTVYANGKGKIISSPLGGSKLVILDSGSGTKLADDQNPISLSGGMDQALADISSVAENARVVSETIRKAVDPSQGGKMIQEMVAIVDLLKKSADDINTITAAVRLQVDVQKADSILAKLKGTADDLNAMTTDAKPKVQKALTSVVNITDNFDQYAKKDIAQILDQFHQASGEVLKVTKNFAELSEQAKQMVAVNHDSVTAMVDNLAQVSANLKAMAAEVRRSPWKLLYKPSEKESRQQDIYDAAVAFSNGATQLDLATAKLAGLAKANPQGIPANDPTVKQVLQDLKDIFQRFSKQEQALWNELQKN